ncbi:MAG: tetratricopeptide repeat protein [Phycisphaeraceae bacterium]|nr:tetratricopeptide repeat protein [Phycisphaeraceae bacterium]
MDVRSLRRKRITILLSVVVLLALVVVGLYLVQKQRKGQALSALRSEGIAAYEAGENELAADKLQPYIDLHPADAEAWYAYARAKLALVEEDQDNLRDALNALRQVHMLQPDNLEAAVELLELTLLVGLDDQAVELADRILDQEPENVTAIRQKIIALSGLGRNEEAWALVSSFLEKHSSDLEMQLAAVQLRYALKQPAAEVIADTRKLYEQNADDPRYELVLGLAYGMGGDQQRAVEHLRAAAAKPMPADVSLVSVVRLLDQGGLFQESLDLMIKQVKGDSDAMLVKEKVRRCFEAGLLDEVARMLAEQDLTAATADVQMAAIAALSAEQSGDHEKAATILAALKKRTKDSDAVAWSGALEVLLTSENLSAGAGAVDALSKAVSLDSSSAYLNSLLGDAYADAGESKLAVDHWRKAMELRPVWDGPPRQLARYYLGAGQFEQAQQLAEVAFVRRPNSVESALLIAQVRAARLTGGDDRGRDDLMKLLDQIDQAVGGPQVTILLRVNTLVHIGEINLLKETLQKVVAEQARLPGDLLAHLAQISSEYELGLSDALLALSGADKTPRQAADAAQRLIDAGHADQAIDEMKNLVVANDPAWQAAWAQVLEAAGDPSAAEVWTKLADQYPDDIHVQVQALRSKSLVHDAAAASAILERLKKLSNQDGTVWRLERARWLLEQGDQSRSLNDAQAMLRDVLTLDPNQFEARVLAAEAYQRAGQLPLAVRELQAALALRPDAIGLKLELARIYQSMRSYEVSAEHLNQVVLSQSASPQLLRRAALLMAQQGLDLRAIAVLEELKNRGKSAQSVDELLLASLYRRNGQIEKADEACRRLLEQPTAAGILFVAGFYATHNRGEEARAVLDRLNGLSIPEDEKQATLAAYFARFGSPDETLPHFRAAVEAAPDNRAHWRKLIAFELTVGEADAALADAKRGAERIGQASIMQQLLENQDLVRQFAAVMPWSTLVVSLVGEPDQQQVAIEALRILSKTSAQDQVEQARALSQLAAEHRDFLTLQIAMMRAYMSGGDNQAAADLATRTMYEHPTSVDAAWLAAEALTAMQRWPEALVAAAQWQQRSAGQALGADMIVAEARLRMGEVQAAMREIQPHLAAALAAPDQYPSVIFSYVRGLVADGRTTEAQNVLRPLLDGDRTWRLLWSRIAALAISDVKIAATWLHEVEPHTPPTAADEQAQLAQGWWSLFLRSADVAHRDSAQNWIEQATATGHADGPAWVLQAIIAELSGRLEQAEIAYRKALELDPKLVIADNNLAMVLLSRGENLDEATNLAKAAVDAEPRNAEYLDTLAQIHAKAGRFDVAIAAMKKAIEVDPGKGDWQWGLLDLYEAAGHESDAVKLRNQLQLLFPQGRPKTSANTP